MRQIPLGRTGLRVSQVGFGGIPIQRLTDEGAAAVVRRCLDLGVTFIDTANGYTTSEARIGLALAGRPRESVVIATKSHAREGAAFDASLALSLQRMNTAYVDIIQFHGVSSPEDYAAVLAPGGALDHARRARDRGLVRHIGVSTHSLALAPELVRSGHFETLLIPFNLISTEPEAEILPLCREYGVGLIAMKPMGGGVFTDARPAINYLRQFGDVLILVGIENIAEIEQIAAIMEGSGEISAADLAEVAALREALGPRYCRRCDYCQPCPQGIQISTVLSLRGFSRRFPAERTFGPWGQGVIARARECADCATCEGRCPYHLPIRDLLREAIAWHEAAAAR